MFETIFDRKNWSEFSFLSEFQKPNKAKIEDVYLPRDSHKSIGPFVWKQLRKPAYICGFDRKNRRKSFNFPRKINSNTEGQITRPPYTIKEKGICVYKIHLKTLHANMAFSISLWIVGVFSISFFTTASVHPYEKSGLRCIRERSILRYGVLEEAKPLDLIAFSSITGQELRLTTSGLHSEISVWKNTTEITFLVHKLWENTKYSKLNTE